MLAKDLLIVAVDGTNLFLGNILWDETFNYPLNMWNNKKKKLQCDELMKISCLNKYKLGLKYKFKRKFIWFKSKNTVACWTALHMEQDTPNDQFRVLV